MMGTGKSTIGQTLAVKFNRPYIDSDTVIEQKAGKTITQIFAQEGEASFRAQEESAIREIIEQTPNCVLATGGGCVTIPSLLPHMLENGIVIWLKASAEDIYDRVKTEEHRPLLQDENPLHKLQTLLTDREPLYSQAHIHIDTVQNDPDATADKVIEALSQHMESASIEP
jgi:shikimate kinase